MRNLKPRTKFAAQSAVALGAWLLGFRILSSWASGGMALSLDVFSLPLTILWIVGITNAFNLIDGIDGLSAGAALFATASMLVSSLLEGHPFSPSILLALAGAIVGFLRFNFNPASIFLGDSGSLMLGSMLSLLAIEYSQKSTAAIAVAVPIIALGLPVLDTAMVIFRRFLNGKPILLGDRRHIHHILIERGLKPRNAVILLYGVSGLFGLFSLLFLNPSGRIMGIVFVVLGLCIWFGIQQLHCPEFRELKGYLLRGMQYQRRLLTGNVIVGRMIDGFNSAHSIPELLESLSSFLAEMEFSRAEVRTPNVKEERIALQVKDWTTLADGRLHWLYRWVASDDRSHKGTEVRADRPPTSDGAGPGAHFRLEFVFKIPRCSTSASLTPEEDKGSEIGRLTFYHPMTSRLPVSAISLLSRQVWKEFGQAITRIMAQPDAELANEKPERNPSIRNANHPIPALARMPLASQVCVPVDCVIPDATFTLRVSGAPAEKDQPACSLWDESVNSNSQARNGGEQPVQSKPFHDGIWTRRRIAG
jgi:UDP-GlcNAc:undecaprenyl-phosphate GlcNAc-1-phosphate transferase